MNMKKLFVQILVWKYVEGGNELPFHIHGSISTISTLWLLVFPHHQLNINLTLTARQPEDNDKVLGNIGLFTTQKVLHDCLLAASLCLPFNKKGRFLFLRRTGIFKTIMECCGQMKPYFIHPSATIVKFGGGLGLICTTYWKAPLLICDMKLLLYRHWELSDPS